MNVAAGKIAVALAGGLFLACSTPAFAQDQAPEQKKSETRPNAEELAREAQQRAMEEFAEAAKLPKNAGQPECVWLGRRVTSLLWRDDPDAARRFIELYDRFNCPAEHLKLSFRCVVRMGPMDQKATQKLAARVHMCWVHPETHPH